VRTRRFVWLAILAALLAFVFLTRGPKPPRPVPPGTFAFAVMGDAPYYVWEEWKWRIVLQDLQANELDFVVDVGDIFWRPCSDEHYRWVLDRFNRLRHPVIYTPGDNETFDCWEPRSGGYTPQSRFARIREIFFADPSLSLGGTRMPLVHQTGEFVENARWSRSGIVFATFDIIGSTNGMKKYPSRTAEDDAIVRRRTEAAAAWVRETFAEAARANAPAVVIAFHANMHTEERNADYTPAFEPFLTTLEEEAARYAKPVLVVHGDGHDYTVDHPFRPRNITRMQVPGSPLVGWVRVVVKRQGAVPAFELEQRVVPRWKFF
jgi:Calcineurin-like phosphoesterase